MAEKKKHFCCTCGKEITKNEIALNKKLVSRDLKEFQCIDCLAKRLDTTADVLEKKISQFIEEGCELFL
jgi:hypothetical protein